MHTIASLYIFLSVYAPFLKISKDSKLRRGFDLPTRIPVGSFTIERIYLAMDAKSPSDVKNLRGHIYGLIFGVPVKHTMVIQRYRGRKRLFMYHKAEVIFSQRKKDYLNGLQT